MRTSRTDAPTERQLRYLRSLAERTATTFASPLTRVQASREIDRLQGLDRAPRSEPRSELDDSAALYATAVNPDELTGYGSCARWRSTPVTPGPSVGRAGVASGRVSELARYSISAGERAVYAEPHKGAVRILDLPVGGGQTYVVEQGVEHDGCAALIAEYVKQAVDLDAVPMDSDALGQLLGVLADV